MNALPRLPERIERSDLRDEFDVEAVQRALLAILHSGLVAARNRASRGECVLAELDYLHNVPKFVAEPKHDELLHLWNWYVTHWRDAHPVDDWSGFAALLRAIAREDRWERWQSVPLASSVAPAFTQAVEMLRALYRARDALRLLSALWFALLVFVRIALGTSSGAAMGWSGAARFVFVAALPALSVRVALLVVERPLRRAW